MATKISGSVWAADVADGETVLIGIGSDTYAMSRRDELRNFLRAMAPHVIEPTEHVAPAPLEHEQVDASVTEAPAETSHAQP